MKKTQLEHVLRAAGAILDETQFIVIGSQSILGKFPDAPPELLRSVEADLIAKHRPQHTDALNTIGELSQFHDTFGYYVDPVSDQTAILPQGWKGRLVNFKSPATNGVTGLCLDPHDLFVAKIAAYREKDVEYVRAMIRHGMVNRELALKLAATVINPDDDLDRSRRIIRRIERLFAEAASSSLPTDPAPDLDD